MTTTAASTVTRTVSDNLSRTTFSRTTSGRTDSLGNTASVSVSIGKNTGTGTVLSPLAPLCEHFQASVSVNDVIVSSSPYHGDGYGSLRSDGEGKEEAVLANQCSPRCFVGNRPEERDDYTDIGAGFEGDSRPATQQEQDFCRDFETAWAAFLLDHPEHVPTAFATRLQEIKVHVARTTFALVKEKAKVCIALIPNGRRRIKTDVQVDEITSRSGEQ